MRAREFIIEGSNTTLENAVAKMIGGYLHGMTIEKNTCYAYVGKELARLKPDDATIRFWGRNPNFIVHGDAVLPNGDVISNMSPDEYEKFGYKEVDTMQLAELLSKVPNSLDENDEPVMRIKIKGPDPKVKAWIEKVYSMFPLKYEDNHVMHLGGEGENQQLAFFELTPSFSKRGAVEVKWFQAFPSRQRLGGIAMKKLQDLAQQDGIALTLFPWDNGRVSQSKLIKFYKQQGFKLTTGKNMVWEPATDK